MKNENMKTKILSLLFFSIFGSLFFLGQVEAEDLQCCYGNMKIGSNSVEEYCRLFSEGVICENKESTIYGVTTKYTDIKKGFCFEGNSLCFKIISENNYPINVDKEEYVVEVGEKLDINDFEIQNLTGSVVNSLRVSVIYKDKSNNSSKNDSVLLANLKQDSNSINFGEMAGKGDFLNTKYSFELDTGKFTSKKDIKTPYEFSLGFFVEFFDSSGETVDYSYKEIKINVKPVNCQEKYPADKTGCNNNPFCIWSSGDGSCFSNQQDSTCGYLNQTECNTVPDICTFDQVNKKCKSNIETAIETQYGDDVPEGYTGFLTECAFRGNCSDVNEFLKLGINLVRWLFGIIGGLALTMFIYGGVLMIISFGNEEKVKQGKNALIAAVIGMIIAFGAYLLIQFILSSLGISSSFNIL